MKNTYAQRMQRERQELLQVGTDSGAQRMADYMAIVLNDPRVMGKAALGRERLTRVFEAVHTLEKNINAAFYENAEQDYWQDILDRRLAEIFGAENLCPFGERYPYLKAIRYGRRE